MNATQRTLLGKTQAAKTGQRNLDALSARAEEVYRILQQQALEEKTRAYTDAAQWESRQAAQAYRDFLSAYNPIGLNAARQKQQTDYADHAAYNTYTADLDFYRTQRLQQQTEAERALEDTRQTLAYAERKTQSEQQSRQTKLMQAYLKQRLALLKKAAKKRIDTAGV